MTFEREYKKLYKKYQKQLNEIARCQLYFDCELAYLATVLKFKRDYFILTEENLFKQEYGKNEPDRVYLLIQAINEYEDYLLDENEKTKKAHLKTFLKLFKENYLLWEIDDATI